VCVRARTTREKERERRDGGGYLLHQCNTPGRIETHEMWGCKPTAKSRSKRTLKEESVSHTVVNTGIFARPQRVQNSTCSVVRILCASCMSKEVIYVHAISQSRAPPKTLELLAVKADTCSGPDQWVRVDLLSRAVCESLAPGLQHRLQTCVHLGISRWLGLGLARVMQDRELRAGVSHQVRDRIVALVRAPRTACGTGCCIVQFGWPRVSGCTPAARSTIAVGLRSPQGRREQAFSQRNL
jgi:hypothetical protein